MLVATVFPTPEGIAMASMVYGLLAMLSVWTLVYAVRQIRKVVTTLFRMLLVLVFLAALGLAAVGIIGHVWLAYGLA
ncbi:MULTISPECIES: hypothetical protein [Nonomuraea]|uniref:hypothetical protein n=1 Tax=Nonomuraea TaxID=83681 RepID=UPI001C5E9D71|nr:hypothetical protein [Nonomuraea ceibae]